MATAVHSGSGEVSGSDTLSERAAGLVERDIIAGNLAPGARLGIVDLVERYDIGATPLREGLSRLISRGLIVGIGQRGFRVADVSREDLKDITQMRTVVDHCMKPVIRESAFEPWAKKIEKIARVYSAQID